MEMTKPAALWKATVLVILCWHGALSLLSPRIRARPSESEGPTAATLRRRSFSLAPCCGLQVGIHIRGKRTAGEPWLSEAYLEYEKRLRPVLTLETHWHKTDSEMLAAIARERVPLICLDENGAQYTSESFTELVYKKLEEEYIMRQINTKEEFDKVLAEAGKKPVLVDYYATWCGPCRKIAPYLEQLEQAYGDKAVFIKVDIEVNKETAEWAKISAMPTFNVMKNKAKVGELVGARQEKLAALLEQHAGVPPGGPVAPPKPASSSNKGTDWLMFLVAAVVAWFGITSTLLTIPRVSHPPVQSEYKPPVAYSEFTEYHLRTLPYSDLMQIFYQLDAPQQKLKGEYTAQLLDAGDIINNMIGALTFTPIHPGAWVGKAFLGDEDFGYNIFFQYGKVKRRFTMQARTGESVFDSKPVFELDYKKQRHILGWLNMRDEIREVRPGLYLGMGTFGLSPQKQMEPMPFYLRGPHAPAQKDVVTGSFRA